MSGRIGPVLCCVFWVGGASCAPPTLAGELFSPPLKSSTRAADLAPADWHKIAQAAPQPPASTAPQPDTVVDLEEVTVTGSARARRRSETTTPVYVIDREQLEQKGARTLGDAIRNVPGVASNIYGAGSDVHNGHFVRGLPTTSTAILIDGRPISNLNQQHFDPGEIPVNNVERVEVMPTGGTTLYGSTALGGVINVITRKPTRPLEGEASVEFGSYGYSKYGAYYQGKSAGLTYNLAYENFNTLNNYFYSVERPGGRLNGIRPNGDFSQRSYNLNLGYALDGRNTLSLDAYLRNTVKGVSPFSLTDTRTNVFGGLSAEQLGFNDDHKSRLSTDTWGVALTWDGKLGEANDSDVQVRLSVDRSDNRELTPDGEDFRTGVYLLGLRATHNWRITPGWSLTYGLDWLKEIGTSEVANLNQVDYNTSIDRPAVFLLNEFRLSQNVVLSAGARYSVTSQYGNSFDPNIGVRWNLAPNFALRSNWSQGFKAPNFDDLYGKTVHKGNPNLLPERGTFFDAGFDWEPSPSSSLRFSTFVSDVRELLTINLVDPRQPDFPYFASLGYVNGDRVRVNYPSVYITGFEFGYNWKINSRWDLFATGTYSDARIIDGLRPEVNQTQYQLVPFLVGNLGLSYSTPSGLRAALFANVVGGRSADSYHVGPADVEVEDPGSGAALYLPHVGKLPTGSVLPGYATLDLSLRLPVSESVAATAYIENLLGTYYEKSYGNGSPGINFRLGLKSTF